jgi:hypothetical protein
MRAVLSVALAFAVCTLPAAAEDAPLLQEERDRRATTADAVSEGPIPPALADAQIEDRIRTILRQRLRTCWRMPIDARHPSRLVVTVTATLNPDGTLTQEPRTSPSDAQGDPEMQAAILAAKTAVVNCAPFPFAEDLELRDHYDMWRELEIVFSPL